MMVSPVIRGPVMAATRFERASDRLVRSLAGLSAVAPIEPIIDMIDAEHQFKANAATARADDERLGMLLNILV